MPVWKEYYFLCVCVLFPSSDFSKDAVTVLLSQLNERDWYDGEDSNLLIYRGSESSTRNDHAEQIDEEGAGLLCP